MEHMHTGIVKKDARVHIHIHIAKITQLVQLHS